MRKTRGWSAAACWVLCSAAMAVAAPLPGTAPLEMQGDIASELVAGADRFLLRELAESQRRRAAHWERDLSSPETYSRSVEPNRRRFVQAIGLRDQRTEFESPQLLATVDRSPLVGRGKDYDILAVRWPAFRGVSSEGLLLVPRGRKPAADVVAIPDADQTPEMLVGLAPGVPGESQFARRLAELGCRVIVPALVSRGREHSAMIHGTLKLDLTHREFLYRPAFELGRHIIGYEVQKVLAAVDWFYRDRQASGRVGVIGYGEGGLLALYAAAADPRIQAACVSGYFAPREEVWREPVDRNVFGLLREFGDAELASLMAPRALIVEACAAPQFEVAAGSIGAPGRLTTPRLADVRREVQRAQQLTAGLEPAPVLDLVVSGAEGEGPFGTAEAVKKFLAALGALPAGELPPTGPPPRSEAPLPDADARLQRLIGQIAEDTQWLLRESEYVRDEFFRHADRQSRSVEKWLETIGPYREHFDRQVIGRFDHELLPPTPRTRLVYDEPKYTGYEVVLDVWPDVFAYGLLLVPKDIPPGQRRPVVVCQHGLEGRPQDVADPKVNHPAYNQYGCRLAERGFVVFAPQNLYIFKDRFRTLQRKANPLKATLFSIIIPQHRQITDWLASLPMVDPQRIAFYGLSYGGKSAMRIPALVPRYCLSICSADFNEWIWKNASTRDVYSYVRTGEYEIFEFDLGSTFNYAEMAALIAPRPFMVERGHRDGVSNDWHVAYEFAKVRLLYADLRIPDRTEIEFFDGPHSIHGVGTFRFLHRHLNWPEPR